MHRRAAAFVLIVGVVLLAVPPHAVRVRAAGGWTVSNALTVGTEGFTLVISARIGDNGTIVVHGQRNGRFGLYRIGNAITPIVEGGVAIPGNLGTPTQVVDFNVDRQGRVVFTALINGTIRAFRWTEGSYALMQPDDGSTHLLSGMNSRNEWITEQSIGTNTRRFMRTNGVTTTLLLDVDETSSNECESVRVSAGRGTVSLSGETLILRHNNEEVNLALVPTADCGDNQKLSWELKRTGPPVETVVSVTKNVIDNVESGSEFLSTESFRINDAGAAAYVLADQFGSQSNGADRYQIKVRDGAGERVLMNSAGSGLAAIGQLVSFNALGQIVFTGMFRSGETAIFAGPDLTNDRVIGTNERIFGQTLVSLSDVSANAPPSTSGDARGILFLYRLADGTEGVALATKGTTRWTNAAGGDWSSAGNWSPGDVPGQGTSVVFGIDGSYNVGVGTQQAGRVEVTDGSVAFNGARLTLLGPLQVGNDADLTVPDGSVTAGEIAIGHLPPQQSAQPSQARLAVSNQGSTLTTAGPLRIGVASDGQFDLNRGAHATSAETLLGAGSDGTANLRDPDTLWTTGSIDVGKLMTGTLVIESGARMESTVAVVGDATVQPNNAIRSSVSVRGQGSTWTVARNLNVGLGQSGEVLVENGATLNATELTLGVSENDADATLEVRGSASSQRSRLAIAENLTVGFLGGNLVALLVRDGALATVGRELVVGDEHGVEGLVSVGRRDAAGNRATLRALSLNGACVIGRAGLATLFIFDGGLVQCLDVHVGETAQGRGEIVVDGAAARLEGEFIRVGEAGSGVLKLQGGVAHAIVATVIGVNGQLVGNGTLEGNLVSSGNIIPDLAPIEPLALQPAAEAQALPGILTVSGTLTISPTGVLELDVLGQAPGQHDRVVVAGAATLGGVLRVNFTEGFAPRTGDVYTFVQAGSTSGAFTSVEITGLAPGFQFKLESNGSLRALNDGVATTQASSRSVYLPLIGRY